MWDIKKKNYRIPTTSAPNHHVQQIAYTPGSILNLHTRTILPRVGKEYMCFQKDGKTAQSARCIKSRIINKVIDYVLYIDKFEQQYVVTKGTLQSPRLKDLVQTIGVDQYLSNNDLYQHKYLEKSKTVQTSW